MGYWCSLHLFDDEKFYKEAVPELKGEQGNLELVCHEFLRTYVVGGISHLTSKETSLLIDEHVEKYIRISQSFDASFKMHTDFHKLKNYDDQKAFLSQLDGHYDFCKFFEYYIFNTCADFSPHLGLGKGGVSRNLDLKIKTLSYDIIGKLDDWNGFFSAYMMGITNWITNEEVELLHLDQENLHFEDNKLAETFLTLLGTARENKLGLICGVDMRDDVLKLLQPKKLNY